MIQKYNYKQKIYIFLYERYTKYLLEIYLIKTIKYIIISYKL